MRFLFRSFIGTRVKIAVLGISLSVLALAGTAHAEPSRKPAFPPSKQPTAKAFSDQRHGLPQPPGPSLMLDERGNRTEYEYDAAGRLVLVRNALGHETRYEYDATGRQTAVIDPLGRTTSFVYDRMGRVVTTILPDGTIIEVEDGELLIEREIDDVPAAADSLAVEDVELRLSEGRSLPGDNFLKEERDSRTPASDTKDDPIKAPRRSLGGHGDCHRLGPRPARPTAAGCPVRQPGRSEPASG